MNLIHDRRVFMANLISSDGKIRYGFYDEPLDGINYIDYPQETPFGIKIPKILRKLTANQFHFAGIIGPDVMVGVAVVDLKYLSNGFFYVYDRKAKTIIETKKIIPAGIGAQISPTPRSYDSSFTSKGFNITLTSFRMMANAPEISVDVKLEKQIEPLRLCTRTGYRGWVYMEKTSPIPVSGKVVCRGKTFDISSPAYMGLMDWTTGFMRRDTYWEWAATATSLPDGRTFGLNLCCGVNETSFTENAFWIDGKRTKVDTVNFEFDSHDLYRPWKIASYDKRVNLTFNPEAERGEAVNALLIKSKFVQFMGTFDGTIVTADGETIQIKGLPGWAEDHYAKW
jgi:hypothetical protein